MQIELALAMIGIAISEACIEYLVNKTSKSTDTLFLLNGVKIPEFLKIANHDRVVAPPSFLLYLKKIAK